MTIRVRATAPGFYGNGRKRVGAEFTIDSEKELGSWMERVDEPEKAPPADEKHPAKKGK